MLDGEELKQLLASIPDEGMSEYALEKVITSELKKNPNYARTILQMLTQFGWLKTDDKWRYMNDEDVSTFAHQVWDGMTAALLKQNGRLI